MRLENIFLLSKKKTYHTKYEIADLLLHPDELETIHYLVEDIRVKDGFGVYSLRVIESDYVFDWDVEIVDKTRKIVKVA